LAPGALEGEAVLILNCGRGGPLRGLARRYRRGNWNRWSLRTLAVPFSGLSAALAPTGPLLEPPLSPILVSNLCLTQMIWRDLRETHMTCEQRICLR